MQHFWSFGHHVFSIHWSSIDVGVDGGLSYPWAVYGSLWSLHLLAGAADLHCPLQLDTTRGRCHRQQTQGVGLAGNPTFLLFVHLFFSFFFLSFCGHLQAYTICVQPALVEVHILVTLFMEVCLLFFGGGGGVCWCIYNGLIKGCALYRMENINLPIQHCNRTIFFCCHATTSPPVWNHTLMWNLMGWFCTTWMLTFHSIYNFLTCRVSTHGCCHVWPWLCEFGSIGLSCFMLSPSTVFLAVSPIKREDFALPVFKVILCWVSL